MEEKNKIVLMVYGAHLLLFIFLGFCFIALWSYDDNLGNSFCKRQGYDAVDLIHGGSYSKYYGKITCYARFEDKRITETFNVTRNKLGRFSIDKK